MAAFLFKKWFCLATANSSEHTYTIRVCIALADIQIQESDNGQGNSSLLFSWLLISDAHDRSSMPYGAIFLEDCFLKQEPVA
jgi:hypothetical protein